jgi:hypothetical protein
VAAPFPSTPIRDSGTGADVNPLPNPPWGGIFYSDAGTWQRVSNAIKGTVTGAGSFNSNYLADRLYAFPIEFYTTLSTMPSNGQTVWLDMMYAGGAGPSLNTPTGYALSYTHNATAANTRFVMYHLIGGAQTAFNSTNALAAVPTAPFGIGARVYQNGAWELWHNIGGAGFTLNSSGTDGSPVAGPFFLGGELESTVATYTNIGGGSIIIPKPRIYTARAVQRSVNW